MLLALTLACVRTEALRAADWPSGCAAAPGLSAGLRTRREEYALSLPDGTSLAAAVRTPREAGCYPALLLIPPGFEPGLAELDEDPHLRLAERGVVVAAFDPRGRGDSGGEDDHGGPQHQDDLALLLTWLAARPEVDPSRVVVRSRSFGLAMAAGALGRHPELAPAALADLEGPATLPEDLAQVPEFTRENFEALATDEAWWDDRSAVLWIGAYTGHYRRIQGRWDHATGPWRGHAVAMLGAAELGDPARVDENGQTAAGWSEETVAELSLSGEINHGEEAVLSLLEDLLGATD